MSSKAIFAAIAVTLAALAAIAVASREETTITVKTFGPVSHLPVDNNSILVPVVSQ